MSQVLRGCLRGGFLLCARVTTSFAVNVGRFGAVRVSSLIVASRHLANTDTNSTVRSGMKMVSSQLPKNSQWKKGFRSSQRRTGGTTSASVTYYRTPARRHRRRSS